MIKTFEQFSSEKPDIIDFVIKKLMYIIREKIEGKLKEGKNNFDFNFKEKNFNTKLNINIDYLPEDKYKLGKNTTAFYSLKKGLYSDIPTINVDYNEPINYHFLFSLIAHELKHAYDYLDNSTEPSSILSKFSKYKNNKYTWHLILMCYVATKKELDARYTMMYDLLRNNESYDRTQLEKIMVESEPFRQLDMLGKLNLDKLVSFIPTDELKDLILNLWFYYPEYIDYDFSKNNLNLDIFVDELGKYFKKVSKEYIEKCYTVLDEIIRDKRPYMENILNIK
jgi:hypothetical protein